MMCHRTSDECICTVGRYTTCRSAEEATVDEGTEVHRKPVHELTEYGCTGS